MEVTNNRVGSLATKDSLGSLCCVSNVTFIPEALSSYLSEAVDSDGVEGLDGIGNLGSLAGGNDALADKLEALGPVLSGSKDIELSLRNSTLEVLGGGLRNLVKGADDGLTGLAERRLGTSHGDGEEAGIGVGDVAGNGLSTGDIGNGLGKGAGAGVPLGSGLTTEEVGKDGNLGLGAGSTLGAGEGDHKSIASGAEDAVLTTVVLGGGGRDSVASLEVSEELAGPLLKLSLLGAGGNDGNVALLVDLLGVGGDGQAGGGDVGDIFGGNGQLVSTQASVEGNVVGGLKGNGRGIVGESVDFAGEGRGDLLVELEGWETRQTNINM